MSIGRGALDALQRHPVAVGALVALLGTGVFAVHRSDVRPFKWLANTEYSSLDLRFRLRGPEPVTDEVVIVGFDDRAQAETPDVFERRAGWASVLRAIHDGGATAIGVDAMFSAPEQLLSAPLVEALRAQYEELADKEGPPDRTPFLLLEVFDEVQGDAKLEAALSEVGTVVLGLHLGGKGGESTTSVDLVRTNYGQVVPGSYLPPIAAQARTSMTRFAQAAAGLGLVTAVEDTDTRVRGVPAGRRLGRGGEVAIPLSVQVLARHLGLDRGDLVYRGNDGRIKLGDSSYEVNRQGLLQLNFRGPAGSYRTYSVAELVKGELPEDALRGKMVLVGLTNLVVDHVTTPLGQRMPGVELHATAIDNLLNHDLLKRTPAWLDVVLALIAGLLVSLLFWPRLDLRPAHQLLGAVVIGGAFAGASLVAFLSLDLWVAAAGPALVQLITLVGCLGAAYLGEGIQRRELRRTFAHYLSDAVISELLADPSRISLRGDRRDLTVLFSDIRSFTTLSEKLPPLELAAFLNTYFTPMTRAVLESGGFLDKYIGDAIMAVFGAPVHHKGHATEACVAAVKMHQALLSLQREMKPRGIDLDIGVGLNTGEMVVGNMGSSDRFDYTVLGDAVNLGSRVEGLTKTYGAFCLVGENTRREAGASFNFRPMDLVRVKGKDQPVEIFELLGDQTHTIRSFEHLDDFVNGVVTYRAGRFADARGHFEAFKGHNPEDKAAALYLERLAHLGDEAPAGWDGVFTHTKK